MTKLLLSALTWVKSITVLLSVFPNKSLMNHISITKFVYSWFLMSSMAQTENKNGNTVVSLLQFLLLIKSTYWTSQSSCISHTCQRAPEPCSASIIYFVVLKYNVTCFNISCRLSTNKPIVKENVQAFLCTIKMPFLTGSCKNIDMYVKSHDTALSKTKNHEKSFEKWINY